MTKNDPLPRKLRSEGFFGVHFDFHAGPDCTEVGKTVTASMIRRMLEVVNPDYVQCDCKGHAGYASYPTRVGTPAPGFVHDPLRIWRDVTRRYGIPLVMHYSGVQDGAALLKHPEWAVIRADGAAAKMETSVAGPYVDELLIPQLLELAQEYGVDGAWVDGDCWATVADYSPPMLEAFRATTGIAEAPRQPAEPHFQLFKDFCRERFRQYLRHYVDALRQKAPQLQVASNWAFSSFMPEPVSAEVPFLSGDFTLADSVNSARFEARCLANQGKPWDLMAWGFGGRWEDRCRTTKSAQQLQQEAATVISLGGGFQAYYKQNRDGSIQSWQMPILGEVGRFCRQRQTLCHRTQSLPQVALHYSSRSYFLRNEALFNSGHRGVTSPMRGVLQCLLDGQSSVDVLMDHHMHDLARYPLVVMPEWDALGEEMLARYEAYLHGGGKVLMIGAGAASQFAPLLGIECGKLLETQPSWVDHNGRLSGWMAPRREITALRGTRVRTWGWLRDDRIGEKFPLATIRRVGKGRIAGVYMDLGVRYRTLRNDGLRDFLQSLVRELMPRPVVELEGSRQVDVVLRQREGELRVNLINTSGPHADPNVCEFDEVTPLGPLTVRLHLLAKPRKILLEPEGRPLKFRHAGGVTSVVLASLHIHSVLRVIA